MSSDLIIDLKLVGKHYLMFNRPEDRLKQMIVPRLKRLVMKSPPNYYRIFEAVKGVSLEVRRGETVGIIGRNGSGKSTLLQMICGTLQASAGQVSVHGRIAALLELGAGFDPEFTGRENVYMNGAIIGLTKAEIDEKFDAITDFADIGHFIDQPTKTYSSGMYVRLAFAVAINADPDILIVDEALSVGDEAFQRKCFARIEDIQSRGATILFVSHNAQSIVKLCDRAVLMDGGEAILQGAPKTVIGQYQRLINLHGDDAIPVRNAIKEMADELSVSAPQAAPGGASELGLDPDTDSTAYAVPADIISDTEDPSWFDPGLVSKSEVSYDSKGAVISDPKILNAAGEVVNNLASGRRYRLIYKIDFSEDTDGVLLGMLFKMVNGVILGGSNNMRMDKSDQRLVRNVKAGERLRVQFDFTCNLRPGSYFMTMGVMRGDGAEFMHRLIDTVAVNVMLGTDISVCDAGFVALDSQVSMRRITAPKDS